MLRITVKTVRYDIVERGAGWQRKEFHTYTDHFDVELPEVEAVLCNRQVPPHRLGEGIESRNVSIVVK